MLLVDAHAWNISALSLEKTPNAINPTAGPCIYPSWWLGLTKDCMIEKLVLLWSTDTKHMITTYEEESLNGH